MSSFTGAIGYTFLDEELPRDPYFEVAIYPKDQPDQKKPFPLVLNRWGQDPTLHTIDENDVVEIFLNKVSLKILQAEDVLPGLSERLKTSKINFVFKQSINTVQLSHICFIHTPSPFQASDFCYEVSYQMPQGHVPFEGLLCAQEVIQKGNSLESRVCIPLREASDRYTARLPSNRTYQLLENGLLVLADIKANRVAQLNLGQENCRLQIILNQPKADDLLTVHDIRAID